MYLQEFDLYTITVSGGLLVSVGESLGCVFVTEGALTVNDLSHFQFSLLPTAITREASLLRFTGDRTLQKWTISTQ